MKARIPRSSLPILAVVVTLAGLPRTPAVARQDPDLPEATTSASAKLERLRADRAGLRASIATMESSDLSRRLLQASRDVLRSFPEESYYPFDTCTLREQDLRFFVDGAEDASTAEDPPRASDSARKRDRIGLIAGYARELEARGVALFVVLVPLRLQVYPEWVPGMTIEGDFAGAGVEYTRLLLELSEAGVEVIDLLPTFAVARDEPSREADRHVLLRHNHHWTPRGMALAADVIAERALALTGLEQGPAKEGVDFSVQRHLDEVANVRIKRPEPVWLQSVVRADGKSGAHALARESPILLIGDSFVRYYEEEHSDLASHLYARTGHRIDRIFNQGSGLGVWKSLARRRDGVAGKRLVVWLCSWRSLSEPTAIDRSLFDD